MQTFIAAIMSLTLLTAPTFAASLVAEYLFSGNTDDSSGNGYHATIDGTVTLTSDRFGNTNAAYTLATGPDRIALPTVVMNSVGGTISMWFKTDYVITGSNGSFLPFFASEAVPDGGGFLKQMSIAIGDFTGPLSGEILGNLGGTGSANPRSAVSVGATGQLQDIWHHVALTSDATGHYYYLDGVKYPSTLFHDGQTQTDNIWITNPGVAWLGGINSNDGNSYNFNVDDLRIYDMALSESQVQNIYNGTVPEPSTIILLSSGLIGILIYRRKTA